MTTDSWADIKDKLSHFVSKLKQDRSLASVDEATTKQTVLLRVLACLGWDIFDSEEVKPEYIVGSQRVDYALRYANANKVFIEVKRVGEDLEKHQEQLLNYSFKEGVKLAVLTNGISWRFYLPLYEGSWEQRKFYTVEIYDQENEDITKRFIDYLATDNVRSGKYVQNAEAVYKSKQKDFLMQQTLPKAWNKLISEPDELLIELIADEVEKLCGYKPDNSIVEDFIVLNIAKGPTPVEPRLTARSTKSVKLANTGNYIGKSATAFIFKNTRYEVKYWIEILIKVCKIIYNLHRKDFDRVLQLRGDKRPYFTKNPDELRAPQEIEGSDIFMETNLSSNYIVKIAKSVITLFGYSDKDLNVEFH